MLVASLSKSNYIKNDEKLSNDWEVLKTCVMKKGKDNDVVEQTEKIQFIKELEIEEIAPHKHGYEQSMKTLLPLACDGNTKSQDMICEIMYEISAEETERYIINTIESSLKLSQRIKKNVDNCEGWANFVMHCICYAKNDTEGEYKHLSVSLQKENRGLSYLRLGIMYEWGIKVKLNEYFAIKCYEKSIELGCKQAYSYLGQYYNFNGDDNNARYYFEQGINHGDHTSYGKLIKYYLNNDWSDDDFFFIVDNAEELFQKLDNQKKHIIYINNAEQIAHKMLNENIKYAHYYYGHVCLYTFMCTRDFSFANKAKVYLETALKNKQYKAYGDLAILYSMEGDEVMSNQYAKEGVKHADSPSRYLVIQYEINKKNYEEAWNLAMEKWKSLGSGSEDLARIYIDYNYCPNGFTKQELINIMEVGLYTNTKTVYPWVVKLLKNHKEENKYTDDLYKYTKIAADLGDNNAIFDLGEIMMKDDDVYYNPVEGCKYLEKAVSYGNVGASIIILNYYSHENNSRSINIIRNKVLHNRAYEETKEFFELLYPIDVDPENAEIMKNFMENVINNGENFDEIDRIKASAKLLINHYNNIWTISNKEKEHLVDYARSVAINKPNCFVFYRPIWKEIFPDFDAFHPSTTDEWIDLYYALIESTEEEAVLKGMVYKNKKNNKMAKEFLDHYKVFCDYYNKKMSDLAGNNAILLRRLTIPELKSLNLNQYIGLKKELIKTFVSLVLIPEVYVFAEALLYIKDKQNAVLQIIKLDIDGDLKNTLFDCFTLRRELENIFLIK